VGLLRFLGDVLVLVLVEGVGPGAGLAGVRSTTPA
jgi:hypothetical protein